jgi:hypothetical protein
MKQKVRFLFFGNRAWNNRMRNKSVAELTEYFQKHGIHMKLRKVVNAREIANTVRALKQSPEGHYANFTVGNFDHERFKPVVEILWPTPSAPVASGNVLEFSPLVQINAVLVRVGR